MPYESLQELLERWRSGEQDAAGKIYQRYEQAILRHARRQIGPELRNKVSPESIMLLVLEYVLSGVADGRYSARSSQDFMNLLRKVADNKIRDKWDYHTAEIRDMNRELQPPRDGGFKITSQETSPETAAIFADDLEHIRERLGPDLFQILQLLMDGYSYDEIGQQFGIGWHTVWRRVTKIKEHLKTWSGDGQLH